MLRPASANFSQFVCGSAGQRDMDAAWVGNKLTVLRWAVSSGGTEASNGGVANVDVRLVA
jgi:hypothetical protein